MKRVATCLFFGATVVLFAIVLYLLISARLTQEKEIQTLVKQHNKLVAQADEERSATEELLTGLEQRLDALDCNMQKSTAVLAELSEKNEEEIQNLTDPSRQQPDPEEVEKLLSLPVEEITRLFLLAIMDSNLKRIREFSAALRESQGKAVAYLMETASNTGDDTEKFCYLYMLSMLRDPGTLSFFQHILETETDTMIRRVAASALVHIPDQSSVAILVGILRNEKDWGVKTNAAAALGVIKDTRAVEPLKQTYLNEQNTMLRNFALASLARIAEADTVEFLSEIARNARNDGHRLIAVSGLKNIGTPEAGAVLSEVASQQTGTIAGEARRALEELQENKAPRAPEHKEATGK